MDAVFVVALVGLLVGLLVTVITNRRRTAGADSPGDYAAYFGALASMAASDDKGERETAENAALLAFGVDPFGVRFMVEQSAAGGQK